MGGMACPRMRTVNEDSFGSSQRCIDVLKLEYGAMAATSRLMLWVCCSFPSSLAYLSEAVSTDTT
jgi:hypothetical protein